VDLELPPELAAHVEEHLHGCVNCEKFVESVRRTKNLAHLLQPLEIPTARLKEIAEKVKHEVEG
jgi:anti-sigma factor RsiW